MINPFDRTRALFHIPDGVIYLDGNSLGPLPKAATARVAKTIEAEWGEMLIKGWNLAGWMDWPTRIGDRIGRLIGAAPGSVVMGDTLSIKVYQALASALELNPDRRVVLSDNGNFPTDLYMAQGLLTSLGKGYELKIVDPEAVEANIDETVAAMMITEVDYRTGRLHDMTRLTQKAHEARAITIWDLAHSAGAIPVDLAGAKADFAVGCTYKYLNGGPGAPAFVFAASRHIPHLKQPLTGWWAHARPFAFDLGFEADPGIRRMLCGTQPILSMRALEGALSVWEKVDLVELRRKSIALTGLFIDLVEQKCAGHGLELASPREGEARGSQVSFLHEDGYAVMQELIARGVVGDFRRPNLMRFGFAPLYLSYRNIWDAAETLREVLEDGAWRTRGADAGALVT
jgi:kynureninase